MSNEILICSRTGKSCAHDCISSTGGYCGDDCYIQNKKLEMEENIVSRGLLIIAVIGFVAFAITIAITIISRL